MPDCAMLYTNIGSFMTHTATNGNAHIAQDRLLEVAAEVVANKEKASGKVAMNTGRILVYDFQKFSDLGLTLTYH